MPDELRHVNVRMPDSLLAALREVAREDARSLNSEILVALAEWLNRRRRKAPPMVTEPILAAAERATPREKA